MRKQMTKLTWGMRDPMRDVVMERQRQQMEPQLVSNERYDKMICEICKSDPTTEADRARLEEEKWEQRRYEIAMDMMACSSRNFIGAESRAAEAIRYADELIKRLKAST